MGSDWRHPERGEMVKGCFFLQYNLMQASKKTKTPADHIIYPKPVRKLRANPEYIDRDRTRSKALVGNLTGKYVVGSLGGVATTIAVPNTMRLRGWSDVMASGAVTIGGRIAVKQMDEGAGDTFMLTRLDIISREISPGRPGQIQ
ncbi:MAG: hypothetical protein MIO93_07200 [ANME-2 cluster archaeon]|nr:hypothetical protein [ANME-2 cluster archaeon]